MQEFTGLEYLQIDIANTFGMDKTTWSDRLDWFSDNQNDLDNLADKADKPVLFGKAVRAYQSAVAGEPIGHIMYMDATASGLQIMAALSGCLETAEKVNMIDPLVRRCPYTESADLMNDELDQDNQVTRQDIKLPLMSHYYNKFYQESFNENQLDTFYRVLQNSFQGAEAVKNKINEFWDKKALNHTWILPDGHVAFVPVVEVVNSKIEVDELDHTTFTYRYKKNIPSRRSTSLAPNIIHSIDAYVCREMIRRGYEKKIPVVPIHDAFGSHANNMNTVRELYREIMTEIAASNLLENILKQLGLNRPLSKFSYSLDKYIIQSEYMLS